MQLMTTAPTYSKFSTDAFDDTERDIKKNQKVSGARWTLIRRANNSSISAIWPNIDDYLACDIKALSVGHLANDIPWDECQFPNTKENIDEIIAAFRIKINNQDVTDLYVKAYKPQVSLNLLHSLVDIGAELFKDARPSNREESEIINSFVRSKSKVISSKKII